MQMKDIRFEDLILFENEDYIVINKPPFISTLEDRNDEPNILSLARGYHAGSQVGHRLDKETSGALSIAKNAEAYRNLSLQFEKRKVTKIYHAICDGIHDFQGLEITLPIKVLGRGKVKIDKSKGKAAKTKLQTLQTYRIHTLVEARPFSGRMHQIRIHLSQTGAPIAGDEEYGGKPFYLSNIKRKYNLKKGTDELPLIKRAALHAFGLGFKLMDDHWHYVEAPYSKDFQVLIKQLNKQS